MTFPGSGDIAIGCLLIIFGVALTCIALRKRTAQSTSNYTLLGSADFGLEDLEAMTDEEVHDLMQFAVAFQDTENAEMISKFLLSRAETQVIEGPRTNT
jgi:hypothetical protein